MPSTDTQESPLTRTVSNARIQHRQVVGQTIAYHIRVPLSRRQIYRRRRVTVFGAIGLTLALAIYLPMMGFAPLAPVRATVATINPPTTEPAALAFPEYGSSAIGAIGFDNPLATSGSAEPRPIASITKIVTALVVLEAKPIALGETGPEITFTAADVGFYQDALALNGSVKSVRSGQVLTQRQLLETVLIPSANNYAMSLANWAFGSIDSYLAAARAYLDSHELPAVSIVDTTGLSPSNTASATDLVAIGKLALANPVIAEITAMTATETPGIGVLRNTNKLLGKNGIHGIKTGTLDEAGACLLFSADFTVGQSTVTVVGAVLGAPDHPTLASHVKTLLSTVVDGFQEVTLVSKGDELVSYSTQWGDHAVGVAADSLTALTWSDTPITMLVAAQPLTTANDGAEVGAATFTAGDKTFVVPVDLDDAIDDPGFWWRITHPGELLWPSAN